jgi:hypothetical protein
VGRGHRALSGGAAGAALALLVTASSGGAGLLAGRVVFTGPVPPLPPIEVLKDHEACGPLVPAEALVVSARTRGVRWAVVSVDGPPGPPAPPGELTLENRQCRFMPHVAALRVGDELAIVNADPVLHNLRAWIDGEARRQVFNVVQPTQGQVTRRTIKRPGVIRLTCDTHVHMSGYLVAFDHPWFAVTDAEGEFRLDDVPAGTWRVSVWHEGWAVERRTPEGRLVWSPARVLSRDVTVPAQGQVRIEFDLSP